ncbi:oligosaccharide flippase family protein [Polaribacter sp.]|nr:oligosaccharide flippase family protein [Polaribacter sp.]
MNLTLNKNIKAGAFYVFANFFDKALIFLTIPVFTRILSSSDYGIVSTYLSIVSTMSIIIGLSLGSSLRSAVIDFKEELDHYLSSILFLAVLNFILTSSIIIIVTTYFSELDMVLVLFCLLQSFMSFICITINIKYMMKGDYIKRTLLLTLPNIFIVTLSFLFIINMNNNKYLGRIIPYLIITSAVGLFYLVKIFLKNRTFYNKQYWSYGLKFSLPLIFQGLSISILSVSDRFILIYYHNASLVGIYSFIYSVSMIAFVFTNALESVWIPWFTKKMENNEIAIINKYAKNYINLGLVATIVILLISPEIITIMAPEEYWVGLPLILPIVLSSFFIFLYSIFVNLEYLLKATKQIALISFLTAAINLILNFIFIPNYGAEAAALTTAFSYFITFVLHGFYSRKLNRNVFPLSIFLKPIILLIILSIFAKYIIELVLLRYMLTIFFITYMYFSNKNFIHSFYLKK